MELASRDRAKYVAGQVLVAIIVVTSIIVFFYWTYSREVTNINVYIKTEQHVFEATRLPDSDEKRDFLLEVKKALADDKISGIENWFISSKHKEMVRVKNLSKSSLVQKNRKESMSIMLADIE